jgi:hypothetical protein
MSSPRLSSDEVSLLATTQDAYSYDRYGHVEWRKCIQHLIRDWGFSKVEAESILRSKWMRFAADQGKGARPSVGDLRKWLNAEVRRLGLTRFCAHVQALV